MNYNLIKEVDMFKTVLEQILTNRGIPLDKIHDYINTKDTDIEDFSKLDNIEAAANKIIEHAKKNNKIYIQVDSDCDGFTSASSLSNYLERAFPGIKDNLVFEFHTGKEHGIFLEKISTDCKLVIIPDAGTNQYEEHKFLAEKGIDVVVLDHHDAEEYSPNAIVVNNQLSNNYNNKSLCGVGVVYQTLRQLDELLSLNYADDFLDLVAIGTVADMMDLREIENRRILDRGLAKMSNPFLSAMATKQSYSLGNSITPIGAAFYIAPQINATMRAGTQEEKEILFSSMLEFKAHELVPSTKRGEKGKFEEIVTQAIRNCTNVKKRSDKAVEEGTDKLISQIEGDSTLDNKLLIAEISGVLDKNYTGLVANKLVAKYQRPVILYRQTANEDGEILLQGSGRGYEKSDIKDFKGFLSDLGIFEYTEGHANAFGLGFNLKNKEELISKSNNLLKECSFESSYDVDYVFKVKDISSKSVLDIGYMKPYWGQNIDEALIAIEGVSVSKNNVDLMSRGNKPTLKITLPNGITLIKFKSSEEEYNSLVDGSITQINIVGTCSVNEWQGRVTPQILVKEYEKVAAQPHYYF